MLAQTTTYVPIDPTDVLIDVFLNYAPVVGTMFLTFFSITFGYRVIYWFLTTFIPVPDVKEPDDADALPLDLVESEQRRIDGLLESDLKDNFQW